MKLNAETHSDNKNLDTNVLICLENTVTIQKGKRKMVLEYISSLLNAFDIFTSF